MAVVDDDIRLLESLENLLESAGYAVRTFSSPKALLAAGLVDVDCLITDIGMAEMDGFELRDAVRTMRPDLPIFMVTGRHEIADRLAKSPLAAALFRKPIDGQLLLAAVDEAFAD
ncbi:MAG: response regulator [Chelatococcus sp.]|nr:response regulator [Chelatococcus sp. YT9]MBX3556841.1 response regulator [Chelatococcus sp.]